MPAKLSTHVLDTYHGIPAAGVSWSLERASGEDTWELISSGETNLQGRTDAPLLEGGGLITGCYRLTFDVAAYFRAKGVDLPEIPFLGKVRIEVGLLADEGYHVPLLASPWSFSTYRGS